MASTPAATSGCSSSGAMSTPGSAAFTRRACRRCWPAVQQPSRGLRTARDLLEADLTNETAWRILLETLIDMGDRVQVIREFSRCEESFHRLLDMEPPGALRVLRDRARSEPATVTTFKSAPADRPGVRGRRMRVAILPFLDRGGADPVLAASLAMDTARGLARFRWFDVISPVSLPRLSGDPSSWAGILSGPQSRLRRSWRRQGAGG